MVRKLGKVRLPNIGALERIMPALCPHNAAQIVEMRYFWLISGRLRVVSSGGERERECWVASLP